MENNIKRHTFLKSIVLHLLPGLLVGCFYFAITPFVKEHGYPSVMALILAGIFVLIPFELGFLLYQKRLKGGKLFNGVLKYCQHIPLWQYFVWVPIVSASIGLIFTVLNFTSDFLLTFFDWIPQNLHLDMGLSQEFSNHKLIITYASFFIFIVLVLPASEELYFRGYLLPRMPAKLKGWTAIVHSSLFALYHVWTPWMFVVRAVGMLPLIYVVRRKNIYLGIIIHCLMNSIDFFIALVFILNYN